MKQFAAGGTLHKLVQLDPILLTVPLRGVTMPEEAMAYVSQTRSLPAGRTPTNLGFVGGWQIDMDRMVFEDYWLRFPDNTFAKIGFRMIAGGDHFAVIDGSRNPSPNDRNLEPKIESR